MADENPSFALLEKLGLVIMVAIALFMFGSAIASLTGNWKHTAETVEEKTND